MIWRPASGVGPIARDPAIAVCDSSSGFVATLTACIAVVLGRVRDVADKPEPVAGADRLGAEFGQALVRDRAGLEIADIVRRVVHELHVPDAAPVRFFEPFELAVEKIQPLDIGDDRRLARLVRRVEIGRAQRPAHAVIGDQLVHPGETVEMVAVELARLPACAPWRARRRSRPRIGRSGTSARHATASDPARIAFARSSFGGAFEVIPVLPPWLWTSTEIDRRSTASAADGGLGRLRRRGRAGRPGLAGEHRRDRRETRSPERERCSARA